MIWLEGGQDNALFTCLHKRVQGSASDDKDLLTDRIRVQSQEKKNDCFCFIRAIEDARVSDDTRNNSEGSWQEEREAFYQTQPHPSKAKKEARNSPPRLQTGKKSMRCKMVLNIFENVSSLQVTYRVVPPAVSGSQLCNDKNTCSCVKLLEMTK